MDSIHKGFISLLSALLLCPAGNVQAEIITAATLTAAETHSSQCPRLNEINRIPGEYSWHSQVAGWEGYFSQPLNARGFSNKTVRFVETRWIQFSNLPDSPGYIQCDYEGDIGGEIIRFTQVRAKATKKPDSEYWVSVTHLTFPSVQATCSASAELCRFQQL